MCHAFLVFDEAVWLMLGLVHDGDGVHLGVGEVEGGGGGEE